VWHTAIVAVAVAALITIWVAAHSGGSSSAGPRAGSATRISPGGLTTLVGSLRQPIYWVGTMPNVTYEMSRTSNGEIFVRYLPAGVKVGAMKPYLTIGSYPLANAFAATQQAASKSGAVSLEVGGGAVAFYNKAHPLSAFIAYPGFNYQVEVFDPAPRQAQHLVASGKVVLVPGSPLTGTPPVSVSAKELSGLAAAVHHPLYWAGPGANNTYELTETSRGWIFIRYLPAGAATGVGKPYLTIATYPIAGAFAAVKRLARGKDAETIKLAGGGLAVVGQQYPKSIYLAYPASNYEIEVFDPSPARARQLVASGKITTIR
jgi:hypothetical protein